MELGSLFFCGAAGSIFELTPEVGCSGLLRGGVHGFVRAAPELVFPGMSDLQA